MTNYFLTEAERFSGWMRLQMLLEQMEQNLPMPISNEGPDPEPMNKLYFRRQEIYDAVLQRIQDMAPHGVSSEQQFHDIVEQAISKVHKELMPELSPEQAADTVLTINDIEREFRATPFTAIGLHQTDMLNEEPVRMSKNYEPKEALMNLFKANVLRQSKGLGTSSKNYQAMGAHNADAFKAWTHQRFQTVLADVKDEMVKTLDMIERTLKMIPPEVFFGSEGK